MKQIYQSKKTTKKNKNKKTKNNKNKNKNKKQTQKTINKNIYIIKHPINID